VKLLFEKWFNLSGNQWSHSVKGIVQSHIEEDTMKVSRFIIAVLFTLALAQVAFAQQGPGGGPLAQAGTGKSATPENFKDKQARILKMIEERRAHLDKAKVCVEAAKTDEDLQKCRPERPMGMGPGGMHRGGYGMQGQGAGMQGGGPSGQSSQTPPADQQQ
jgi:hypothetical protein